MNSLYYFYVKYIIPNSNDIKIYDTDGFTCGADSCEVMDNIFNEYDGGNNSIIEVKIIKLATTVEKDEMTDFLDTLNHKDLTK